MSPDWPISVIYGGTFDPFHHGHEAICQRILAAPQVAQLRLIPCATPALKAKARASAEHRLTMLELWRAQQPQADKIVIDTRELDRDGPSYSIDTVESLQAEQPQRRWLFVMGADAWNSLANWQRVEAFIERVGFWVFTRAGQAEPMQHNGITQVTTLAQLAQAQTPSVLVDDSVQIPLASSQLRAAQKFTQAPDVVCHYIQQHNLYR